MLLKLFKVSLVILLSVLNVLVGTNILSLKIFV